METIISKFESVVATNPERIALDTKRSGRTTYGQLNCAANRIAHAILSLLDSDGNDCVALFYTQGEKEEIEAIVGTLKVRKAVVSINVERDTLEAGQRSYLPHGFMDDSYVRNLLFMTDCELILCDEAHYLKALAIAGNVPVINTEIVPRYPETNPGIKIRPSDTEAILHTSGTVDPRKPKAVRRTHRMEAYNIEVSNEPATLPDDRATLFRSASTGALSDIWLTLLNGARLCLFYPGSGLDLTEWVIQKKITVFRGVAPVFRQLDFDRGRGFADVRWVNIGGAMVTPQDVSNWRRSFIKPNCLMTVRYGASEVGNICYWTTDKGLGDFRDPWVPVGYPLGDRRIEIVGAYNQPGTIGQIAVHSEYLAEYFNQDAETTARFTNGGRTWLSDDKGYLRADRCLVHLGRFTAEERARVGVVQSSTVFDGLQLEGSETLWTK